MKLLLVRHATAVPRGTPGVSDDDRPLTPEGKTKFLAAARGLARIKEVRGVALIQDPAEATKRTMPDAAIAATVADAILPLEEIGAYVHQLCVRETV